MFLSFYKRLFLFFIFKKVMCFGIVADFFSDRHRGTKIRYFFNAWLPSYSYNIIDHSEPSLIMIRIHTNMLQK